MGPLDWWKKVVLQNYANFSGRARRAEYWWFTLVHFVVLLVVVGVLFVINDTLGGLAYILAGLGTLLPSLAVLVRRLHDIGKSGWWYFIAFIPLVGPIILLVFACTDSSRGTNQYGPSPKYP